MAEGYVHGIVIKEGTGEVRAIRSPSPYVLAFIGTAPSAVTTELVDETPKVFFKKRDALKVLYPKDSKGEKGSLFHALEDSYVQTDATVILIKAKDGTEANILAAIARLEDAESITGYKPKVIAAPGFGSTNPAVNASSGPVTPSEKPEGEGGETPKPESDPVRIGNTRTRNAQPTNAEIVVRNVADVQANSIAAKLKEMGGRLGAIVCQDGPDPSKFEDVQAYRKANGSDRVYIVCPQLKFAETDGSVKPHPGSAAAAGIFARIDFWKSPSNQEVYGAVGTLIPIPFALDDAQSLGQRLNSIQVATFVRQDGLRLWGARGTGDQTNLSTNQIQKVRIRDAIREAIIASHRWAIAMGITSNLFEAVAGSVNAYLDVLAQKGAIAGGKCIPDTEQNTPINLSDGKVFWTYDFTPTPVAETLTFIEVLTDKYLAGLGTA